MAALQTFATAMGGAVTGNATGSLAAITGATEGWIKGDPELRQVPVVVLSGSDLDEDVREAQTLGAHSYIVKPMTARYLSWITRSIASYRARLARLGTEPS